MAAPPTTRLAFAADGAGHESCIPREYVGVKDALIDVANKTIAELKDEVFRLQQACDSATRYEKAHAHVIEKLTEKLASRDADIDYHVRIYEQLRAEARGLAIALSVITNTYEDTTSERFQRERQASADRNAAHHLKRARMDVERLSHNRGDHYTPLPANPTPDSDVNPA